MLQSGGLTPGQSLKSHYRMLKPSGIDYIHGENASHSKDWSREWAKVLADVMTDKRSQR
jgi:hypothetical protein